jgi:hypothetical protein
MYGDTPLYLSTREIRILYTKRETRWGTSSFRCASKRTASCCSARFSGRRRTVKPKAHFIPLVFKW